MNTKTATALCGVIILGLSSLGHGSVAAIAMEDSAASAYEPGQAYFGRNQYIEYIAGDLPFVIAVPHGGYLKPDEIADRTWGKIEGPDFRTQELARELGDYFELVTGRRPHIVINRLHRIKLDANREIVEAAQGDPYAEIAWNEFHAFIDDAKAAVMVQCRKGHYIDLHMNKHEPQWVELGFRLSSTDLDRSDLSLDRATYKDKSSVRNLAYTPGVSFPEIVRGETSLGGLLQARGYRSVPSPGDPGPAGQPYYTGGYNTERHGSRSGGTIDATQIEVYREFSQDAVRAPFMRALAESISDFLETHYGFDLSIGSFVCPTFEDVPANHPYYAEIEVLYGAGYTAGCAVDPLRYCPEQTMNRAESAVFVERGIRTATYDPPAASAQVFADLALDSWAAKWANALWEDQYTAGCGTDPLAYCPWQGHTRAEGCVFYLRMLNGATYEPPQSTQEIFADVSVDAWYAKWVQAAYDAGLLTACQTSPEPRFCPNDPLTRALAAYMMVQAKGLTIP